jgi:hypothetical protein
MPLPRIFESSRRWMSRFVFYECSGRPVGIGPEAWSFDVREYFRPLSMGLLPDSY